MYGRRAVFPPPQDSRGRKILLKFLNAIRMYVSVTLLLREPSIVDVGYFSARWRLR